MRRHYSAAFKAQVVREILREDKPISRIASEHGIHPNVLHSWKAQALEGLPRLFEGRDDVAALRQEHEREKHELYEEVYLQDYASPKEARQGLDRYFAYYNNERPQQALGYQTPAAMYTAKRREVAAAHNRERL